MMILTALFSIEIILSDIGVIFTIYRHNFCLNKKTTCKLDSKMLIVIHSESKISLFVEG